jgi:hypothetical protein
MPWKESSMLGAEDVAVWQTELRFTIFDTRGEVV